MEFLFSSYYSKFSTSTHEMGPWEINFLILRKYPLKDEHYDEIFIFCIVGHKRIFENFEYLNARTKIDHSPLLITKEQTNKGIFLKIFRNKKLLAIEKMRGERWWSSYTDT